MNQYATSISIFVGLVRGYIPSCMLLGTDEQFEWLPGKGVYEKIVFILMALSLIIFYQFLMRFIM